VTARRCNRWGAAVLLAGLWAATAALAGPVENPIARFNGLDKITGRITAFSVPINKTRRFGALFITPRACHTRPETEEPRTMAFVEVDIRRTRNGRQDGRRRIFTGWMNAESPGLNAMEHPIFDVWLTGCHDPNRKREDPLDTPPQPQAEETPSAPRATDDDTAR